MGRVSRAHVVFYFDVGAVRPSSWGGDGDANGRVRERFIGGYELDGACWNKIWWLASKGSVRLEGVFVVRGPIKGYAKGEVEVVEGGVSGNGEGAGYYWVGYFEKIYTEDVVVGLGAFRGGIDVAGGHRKWSKCKYKSRFSCQGRLWSLRSGYLLAYMREVVCLLITMEGIEAEDFRM